jgi:hypothetical protein
MDSASMPMLAMRRVIFDILGVNRLKLSNSALSVKAIQASSWGLASEKAGCPMTTANGAGSAHASRRGRRAARNTIELVAPVVISVITNYRTKSANFEVWRLSGSAQFIY